MSEQPIRCWQCGIEPVAIEEIRTMADSRPVRVVVEWPPGDHEHAEHPPTPAELEREGYRSLRRILEDV